MIKRATERLARSVVKVLTYVFQFDPPMMARFRCPSWTRVTRFPRLTTGTDASVTVGYLFHKGIDESEERHVSGSPAVHGSMAHMALGMAPLLE